MDEGFIFIGIVALIISLTIQYYLIKGSVSAALKKNSEQNQSQRFLKLLELIAAGTAKPEEWKTYSYYYRKKEYEEKLSKLRTNYAGSIFDKYKAQLDEKYSDILPDETKKEA